MRLNAYRLFFALLIGAFLMQACSQPDIKLVNKMKSFEPRWAGLSEKMSYLDRNLSLAEKRFESDFDEIEGMVQDSVRGRKYRKMVTDYDSLIIHRDTMRLLFVSNKVKYVAQVDIFNVWEKQVMAADIETKAGLETLKGFKKIQKRLESQADSMTTRLKAMFISHNMILREISAKAEIFTNYDIKMK